jgi:hypothetical protein
MNGDSFIFPDKVDLRQVQFTAELLRAIPASVARQYRVLPLRDDSFCLRVAFAEPCDLNMVDGAYAALQRELEIRVADPLQLDEFIEKLYGSPGA